MGPPPERRCDQSNMRILVIGCGYVGLPLAQTLARMGHQVHGTRRSEFSAADVTPHALDVTDPSSFEAIPKDFDVIYYTPSSSRGDASVHQAVFVDGTAHLLNWLGDAATRLIFTSSTSVYPQTDGNWVDETANHDGATGTAINLLQAEALFQESPQLATILRVAGIYGPERGYLYRQFLKDEAVITQGGSRWINMIHRDDVVSALVTALNIPPGIYNVSDDEPLTQRAFFEWLAKELDKTVPPEGEVQKRKRAATNKRVSNAKLKATDWQLKYPNFREGYGALINEEQGGH